MNGQDKYRERQRFEVDGVEFFLRKIPSGGGVSAFLMMETQVTQALYEAVMGTNPSFFTGIRSTLAYGENLRRPVEMVSWEDGVKFANALSEKLGLQPAYHGFFDDVVLIEGANGFRLPFESEWEWAARGAKSHKYAGSDNLDEVGWCWENSDWSSTRPVGQKQANAFGLKDMSGNVYEWCWDEWRDTRFSEGGVDNPYLTNPGANDKTTKGGSYRDGEGCCTVAYKLSMDPLGRSPDVGFRLAR